MEHSGQKGRCKIKEHWLEDRLFPGRQVIPSESERCIHPGGDNRLRSLSCRDFNQSIKTEWNKAYSTFLPVCKVFGILFTPDQKAAWNVIFFIFKDYDLKLFIHLGGLNLITTYS